jgi:tetratricopeptide (TPR) repeat protein
MVASATLLQTPCPDENELGAFLDARLDGPAVARLREHVDTCAGCREMVSAIVGARTAGSGAPTLGAAVAGDGELPIDAQVGRFVVMGRLGRGGMGVVYRAHDPALDRDVALKLLRADRLEGEGAEAASVRLEREARAIARIRHPNVVAVHDVGTFAGRVFLTMELVEGETLASHLARERRPVAAIVAAFEKAGLGLVAAHDAGLVHRDFKPENVLVGRDGRVVVTDFGLACADDAAEPSGPEPLRLPLISGLITRTGARLGTPAYMAPEQHRGEAVSARTDQFCFCVALWEALFGALPFRDLDARLAGRVATPPASVRVPARVRRGLLRGLRPSPNDRHASMRALLRVIAPPRSRFVAPVLSAFGAAALVAGVAFAGARHADVCATTSAGLVGVWDAATKRAVDAALLATAKPYAADTVREVDRALDAYASGWSAARRDACEATSVRHEQSAALLDRRMSCLDTRRSQLTALVTLLGQGGDTIERAADAAHKLPSLAACSDSRGLMARVGLPEDPRARAEAEAIDGDLSRVRAERDLGRAADAATHAAAVVTRARALGHEPLLARALWFSGVLEEGGEDPRASEATLREAARLADAASDDDTRARAWIELLWLFGYRTERSAEGFAAADEARTAITRLGGNDELEAKRLEALGVLLYSANRSAESIDAIRRAVALRERTFGADASEVGEAQQNLANVLVGTGADADREALALLRRTVEIQEKRFGPLHPRAAEARLGLARVLGMTGHQDEGIAEARKAIPILEAGRGADHPMIATAHGNLGLALDALGQHEEALVDHRRALAIFERALGPDHREVANAWANVGSSLASLHRYAEAEGALQRSLAILEETLPKDSPTLVPAVRMLGELRVEQGRPGEAIGYLERALRLVDGEGPGARGEVRFLLARARLGVGKKAEAQAMARLASEDLTASGEAGAGMLKDLQAWQTREHLR